MPHTRVYVRDAAGTYTELPPEAATDALTAFWEEHPPPRPPKPSHENPDNE
jgi:hypothetical protein